MATEKKPGLLISLVPIFILIVSVALCVRLFGDSVTAGPSQIALLLSALVAMLIGVIRLKISWKKIEDSYVSLLGNTAGAIFILLTIGAVTGSWMASGIVPTLIYYGLRLIHPTIFLPLAFILCSLISLVVGSSWTTVGTFGVALLAAGQIIGLPAPWIAGAIISGAYFGDKTSFLSDTTNLAASCTGVPLFTHVKYMLVNTIPVFVVSLIIFTIAGFCMPITKEIAMQDQILALQATYNISPWLLIIPCLTIFMIIKKVSPFVTLFLSAMAGGIGALIAQPQICCAIAQEESLSLLGGIKCFIQILSSDAAVETGNEILNRLTATSGMSGMLNTVWLILCVTCFGGVMTATGMIRTITERIVRWMHGTLSLIATTLGTSIFFNLTLSDQYMAIVIPGRMFADVYRQKGYAPELLSRTLEESGTVTSVLVPWNTCAVAQSTILGISTLTYLPYCFFNILTPIFSIIAAAFQYKIRRISPSKNPETPIKSEA